MVESENDPGGTPRLYLLNESLDLTNFPVLISLGFRPRESDPWALESQWWPRHRLMPCLEQFGSGGGGDPRPSPWTIPPGARHLGPGACSLYREVPERGCSRRDERFVFFGESIRGRRLNKVFRGLTYNDDIYLKK